MVAMEAYRYLVTAKDVYVIVMYQMSIAIVMNVINVTKLRIKISPILVIGTGFGTTGWIRYL
ncbi:8897_t:CDS:1, partial [Ambispora gerdemannii]